MASSMNQYCGPIVSVGSCNCDSKLQGSNLWKTAGFSKQDHHTFHKFGMPLVLIVCQTAAFVPVFVWLTGRFAFNGDGLSAFVACGAAIVNLTALGCRNVPSKSLLLLSVILTGAYATMYSFLPGLVRTGIAVSALYCTTAAFMKPIGTHITSLGLFLLALPIMPSLQFYLGYPLRVVSGTLAVVMLRMNGYSVSLMGVSLEYGGHRLLIDAPCSGVNMLWTAVFLTLILAAAFKMSTSRTMLALISSVGVVIVGNAVRSSTLFQIKMAGIDCPDWCHTAVGIVSFAGISALLGGAFYFRSRRLRCESLCSI